MKIVTRTFDEMENCVPSLIDLNSLLKISHYLCLSSYDRLWIAGGSIVRLLDGRRIFVGDIDVFFQDKDVFEEICDSTGSTEDWMTTPSAVHFSRKVPDGPYLRIQLIKIKWFSNVETMFSAFDWVHCQAAYHPYSNKFYFTKEGLDAITKKELILNKASHPTRTLRRMAKYLNEGYFISKEMLKELICECHHSLLMHPENEEHEFST